MRRNRAPVQKAQKPEVSGGNHSHFGTPKVSYIPSLISRFCKDLCVLEFAGWSVQIMELM